MDRTRFNILYELSRMAARSEQEILDFALEAGVTVTESDIGYIYLASADETKLFLHAWSKNVMPNCSVENYPDAYNVSDTGLWGEAVRQRKAIITNDYDQSPFKKGYPEGHLPVKKHMNLPVFDDEKIVLIAGVGNKKTDYTQEDVQQLSLIMDGMWNIVKRKRIEEQLRQTNENLEKMIQERTVALEKTNDELHRIIEMQRITEQRLVKSEAVFRGVFDNASTPIVMTSADGRISLANRICAELLGYSQKELCSLHMLDLLHPDDLENAKTSLIGHLRNGDLSWDNERKLITKNGKTVWGHLNLTVIKDEQDNIDSFIIVATDITARKIAEKALKKSTLDLVKSREQLQIIMDNVPALISYVDRNLNYRFVNQQYQVMYSLKPETFIGKHVRQVIGEEAYDKVKNWYEKALSGESCRFEIEFENQNKEYILDVEYIPHESNHRIIGIFILVLDITERKKMERHLEKLSITDPLTGAKNRRFFMENAQKELARAKRYGYSLTMMLMDIDRFKSINDTYGHDVGDTVLKELVNTSEKMLRDSDIFSRIGGEEFAAVLIETDLKKAVSICNRLRRKLEKISINLPGAKVQFTVSIGLSEFADNHDSVDQMIKRADNALYDAKNSGRNRVAVQH